MNVPKIKHDIVIPEGVSVVYEGGKCSVKGPKGVLSRMMSNPKLVVEANEKTVSVSGKNVKRGGKALLGTWKAHLNNMINGVNSGFRYEMKIVYSHLFYDYCLLKHHNFYYNYYNYNQMDLNI